MAEILFWLFIIVVVVAGLAIAALVLLGAVASMAPSDLMDLREKKWK